MCEKEKLLESEKEKITNRMKEMEESLELTRNQNDLLLSQLTSLGDQVEKTQFDRIEASTGDVVSSVEVETLRKEVSDLREVVKFMRSEREMNEAKIDAARRTAEREKAVSAVTIRSLDEARAEIKLLQEQISSATAAPAVCDEEGSLKKDEEQLALLQESNRLLRSEGKKLQESLESALVQLDEQRQLVAPLKQKHNELSVEKVALVAEKCSLQRELESWKQRVQSLVSKFNQIDPEEHNRVLKQAETLGREINDLKAQKEVAEKEGTNAKAIVSKLNKELAQQKALVQRQQSLLKKIQSDKESSTAPSSATAVITKENAMLKEKLQKMDIESRSNQTELKGASDRIEMLKQRMRQFQKTIGEQRKKISDLESAAAAPVTGSDVKAPSNSLPFSVSPQKAAMPVITAESTSASETKEEQKIEPKDCAPTVEKELPAVVDVGKESLPSTPIGGFKFGPSSTSAPARKEETQKRAAPAVVAPADKSSSSAPPSKRAKVLDKAQETVKDAAETEKLESLVDPRDAMADDKTKADGKANAEEKSIADEKARAEEKDKAAQVLKDQLMRKRDALVQRKKNLEEATAKQQAQQSPIPEAQLPETKATPVPNQLLPGEASAAPVVLVASSEPEPESKGAEKPAIEATAEVKVMLKSIAHAAKVAVDEKAEVPAPVTEAPKTLSFGTSPFGNATFGSGTAPTFGSTSFGKPPSGGGLAFGTSPSILGFGSSATQDYSSKTSSVFLDMKPPSSTAAPFTFGSTSITLPTPSIAAPPSVASPFGAFGGSNPFGGGAATNSAALPLFGSSTSIKRVAPEASAGEEQTAKQARVELESEGEKEGE
jgi:nucleoprotein TPR